jgi:DHA3 family macrolide efflux protein-like MFS transporter
MYIKNDNDLPWRLRYWSIFFGQGFSLAGSALTQFVLLWWIIDTTENITALGLAGIAALLPQVVLGPVGGIFADRYNRRIIMIVSDLVSAACMVILIVLFISHTVALWHVYLFAALRSAMFAFQQPAALTSIPGLVPQSFLTRAISLNQVMAGIVAMGAAPLGALAVTIMPLGWALGIEVITAITGVIPLFFYAIPQPEIRAAKREGLRQSFTTGIYAVWHNMAVRQLFILMAFAVLVIAPLNTMTPLLVKLHFLGGPYQIALIESAGGLGMILGGLFITLFPPSRCIPWMLRGFTLACTAIALTACLPATHFSQALFVWFLASVAGVIGNVAFMAFIQSEMRNDLQGRVLSVLTTLSGLAALIGIYMTTLMGELTGVRTLFIILGFSGGVVTLTGFLSSAIREAEKPETDSHPGAER